MTRPLRVSSTATAAQSSRTRTPFTSRWPTARSPFVPTARRRPSSGSVRSQCSATAALLVAGRRQIVDDRMPRPMPGAAPMATRWRRAWTSSGRRLASGAQRAARRLWGRATTPSALPVTPLLALVVRRLLPHLRRGRAAPVGEITPPVHRPLMAVGHSLPQSMSQTSARASTRTMRSSKGLSRIFASTRRRSTRRRSACCAWPTRRSTRGQRLSLNCMIRASSSIASSPTKGGSNTTWTRQRTSSSA
mmetsp:Transcript_18133/g.36555  ORF Transcript_18133/g.36555 Transcript_18133/m.36555 type:complete len:248 (-) Transcript_18133:188-931(-)